MHLPEPTNHACAVLAGLLGMFALTSCDRQDTRQSEARKQELLKFVLDNDHDAWFYWEQKLEADPGYVDDKTKAAIAKEVFEKHDYGAPNTLVNLRYLACPPASAYLHIMFLRHAGSKDPLARKACLRGLDDVDPEASVEVALTMLEDSETSPTAAAILARRCNSEILWQALQDYYGKVDGKPEFYATWTTLKDYFIEMGYAESRAALRRRAQEGVQGHPGPVQDATIVELPAERRTPERETLVPLEVEKRSEPASAKEQ
jgi:hypothetical protein